MEGVNIGVLAPHTGRAAGPQALAEVATAAESLGFASLWVGDHLLLPSAQESSYPYGAEEASGSYEVPSDRPFLEAFCTLSFLSAVTRRCVLGVSVAILPYRHPAHWAKLIGTANLLAGGRLAVGAGTGWMAEEFRALGSDFGTRGARTDETLDFLRHAWSQHDAVSYAGEYTSVEGMYINPGAGEKAPPPVWIGGNGSVALRRTARYGDVWHPHVRRLPPERLARGLAEISEQAAAERPRTSFTGALHAPLRLADTVAGDPWEIGRIEGPADYVREVLEQYRDAGLSDVVLTFGGSPGSRIRVMEQLSASLLDGKVVSA